MSRLTEEQKRIAAHPQGVAAVIAVPGSGKTTALLALINDLKARGQDPRRILCVTFTRAAAGQMRPRLAVRTGADWAGQIDFRTLHSFAYRVVEEAGHSVRGRVLEEPSAVLRPIMQEVGLRNTDATAVENMSTELSRYVGMMSPRNFMPQSFLAEHFEAVRSRYAEAKTARSQMDLDDLVAQAVDLLAQDPAVRHSWHRRYDWRLVDEHQDTSPLQWELIRLATPGETPNLVVAGDDDQAIYSWRGGTNAGLLHIRRWYPSATIYPLSLTHRCPHELLDPAARMVACNRDRYPKEIRSEKSGGRLEILRPQNAADELDMVVDRIRRAVEAGREPYRIAVLYRTNAQAVGLVPRLEEVGLPFYQQGGVQDPFARWAARDLLSYLKVAHLQGDFEDLERITRRPQREGLIGREARDQLYRAWLRLGAPLAALKWVAENGPFREASAARHLHARLEVLRALPASDAIDYVLEDMEYRRGLEHYCKWSGSDSLEALEHVQALTLLAKPTDPSSIYVELANRPRRRQKRVEGASRQGICLSSMHSAKGLEWPLVFIIGAVESNHPRQTESGPSDVQEERRLLYVAMTRAKSELVISVPQRWSQEPQAPPSPFLEEAGLLPAVARWSGGRIR